MGAWIPRPINRTGCIEPHAVRGVKRRLHVGTRAEGHPLSVRPVDLSAKAKAGKAWGLVGAASPGKRGMRGAGRVTASYLSIQKKEAKLASFFIYSA